ncbi:MAG: polyprenyl diphosphate synthase [Bryobacteraceae bacterium]
MFHVAIILDGNGRWASQRRLPRLAGHRQGAEAVRRTITAAPALGITDLTVYAFSSDNWKRPATETAGLMFLLKEFLDIETPRCIEKGVRVSAIGRRDRLPVYVQNAIADCENATRAQTRLHLRIALDYSSRDSLLQAARGGCDSREAISARLPAPDVDLLIRTAGEQRLSDFLLWECAYAEFHFISRLWPDFTGQDLASAVADFRGRARRFGGLPEGWCEVPA